MLYKLVTSGGLRGVYQVYRENTERATAKVEVITAK